MNVLTSSIFPLNKGNFATSTLAPLFCCSKVATYYCRLAIRMRSCSFWVEEVGCSTEAANCSADCCYWNMDGSSGDGDGDDSLYEDKQFSLSELMTSYWLEE